MSEELSPEERAEQEIEAARAREAAKAPGEADARLTTSEAIQTWVWVLVGVMILMAITAGALMGFLGGRLTGGGEDYRDLLGAELVDRGGEIVFDPVKSPGASETAGLRTGDELISIDGESFSSASGAQRVVGRHKTGDSINVVVRRPPGRIIQTVITLGVYEVVVIPTPRPSTSVPVITAIPNPQQNLSEARMGIRYRMILPDDPFEVDIGAMILVMLDTSGPAARAGLTEGDIIISVDGDSLSEFYTLQDALEEFEPGDRVWMVVWRDGDFLEVTVTMGG